jgi:hypothetical protein
VITRATAKVLLQQASMRSVALLLSFSLAAASGGCFPHNSKHRTYAQLTEGGMIVGGIGILTVVGTGADCDVKMVGDMSSDSCKTRASVIGNVGLGLILAGLVGFIATVSTAEDDKPAAKPDAIPPTPPTPPAPAPIAPTPPEPANTTNTQATEPAPATPATP